MERPKMEDYYVSSVVTFSFRYDMAKFLDDTIKYCDYLESLGDCTSHYEQEIQRLEKENESLIQDRALLIKSRQELSDRITALEHKNKRLEKEK